MKAKGYNNHFHALKPFCKTKGNDELHFSIIGISCISDSIETHFL